MVSSVTGSPSSDGSAAAPASTKARRVELGVTLAFAAALVASLWIVDYLPTGDGPNHALTGVLARALHDPERGYDAFVAPGHPRSSLFFHEVYSTLLLILPWRHALRATLSFGALLWAIGLGSVATALHRGHAAVALFGFATALSWNMYVGLFSYWMTLGAGLCVLGFALRRSAWAWRDRLFIGAAMVLMVLAHSFVAVLLGGMLVVLVAVRPSPLGRLRELLALALVGLPAAALAYFSFQGAGTYVAPATQTDQLAAVWLPLADRFELLWKCFTGGPLWRGLVPLVAALIGLVSVGWRVRAGRASRDELAVGIMSVALLVAVIATPIDINMWHIISPRFAPWGLALGVALLPVEELGSMVARTAANVAMGAFAAASIGWAGLHHIELARRHADILAISNAPLHRTGARLPIGLLPAEGGVSGVDDVTNFGQIAAINQGGMTPYLFATRPELHPFAWIRPPRELFPPYPTSSYAQGLANEGALPREVALTLLAQIGAGGFEDVILWGLPGDADAFLERGYVADARQGGAAILRFAPCGLDVDFDAKEPLADPVIAQFGWAPLVDKAAALSWPIGESFPDGVGHAHFAGAPCGPVWVRVTWDRDRSGKAGPGDRFCQGADDKGRVHAVLTHEQHHVQCHVGPGLPTTPDR